MPESDEVTQYCSSLVEVLPAYKINLIQGEIELEFNPPEHKAIQLAHSSVKLFLNPDHLNDHWAPFFVPSAVHASVATISLCYTIHLGVTGHDSYDRSLPFPFTRYSGENWTVHAAAIADVDNDVHDLILEFLLHPKEAYKRWTREILGFLHTPDPLYITCHLGLIRPLQGLLDNNADPNAGKPFYFSGFYVACERGRKEIIQLLLSKGADPSRQHKVMGFQSTPLAAACRFGHHDVVSMLLEHLHNSNITRLTWKDLYEEAIFHASLKTDQHLIQMLLKDISNINFWSWEEVPPINILTMVCESRSTDCVRIVLDHLNGAKIDVKVWSKLLKEAFDSFDSWPLGYQSKFFEMLRTQLEQLDIDNQDSVFANFALRRHYSTSGSPLLTRQ